MCNTALTCGSSPRYSPPLPRRRILIAHLLERNHLLPETRKINVLTESTLVTSSIFAVFILKLMMSIKFSLLPYFFLILCTRIREKWRHYLDTFVDRRLGWSCAYRLILGCRPASSSLPGILIIVANNGTCGNTCTFFGYFFRSQHGAFAIVF